jgi:hypothetical protein
VAVRVKGLGLVGWIQAGELSVDAAIDRRVFVWRVFFVELVLVCFYCFRSFTPQRYFHGCVCLFQAKRHYYYYYFILLKRRR